MNKFNLINAFFLMMLAAFCITPALAQNENAPEISVQKVERNRRPNLLAELNLSPQQIGEIRRLNRENRFSTRAAQQRLRDANRSLDDAIYADTLDEANVQSLIKELQTAQTEAIKLRAASELAVRKILNAQQLAKFRGLLLDFKEQNRMRPNRRQQRPRNFLNRRLNTQPQKTPAPRP